MDLLQGPQLSSLYPPRIVTSVFRQLSTPWESIAREYADQTFIATTTFLRSAVKYAAGRTIGDRIIAHFLNDRLEDRRDRLSAMVTALLVPYQQLQPLTFSSAYEKAKEAQDDEEKDHHRSHLAHLTFLNMDQKLKNAATVLDQAEAYYQVRLLTTSLVSRLIS
jgi:hypothetical protein